MWAQRREKRRPQGKSAYTPAAVALPETVIGINRTKSKTGPSDYDQIIKSVPGAPGPRG